MRQCGECTLCCKLERIVEVETAANEWCKHCAVGNGCRIYPDRPKVCQNFVCAWLKSDMPDEMRPDRVHWYAHGSDDNPLWSIAVDPDFPDSWKAWIDFLRSQNRHFLIREKDQLTFLPSPLLDKPEKLIVEWIL